MTDKKYEQYISPRKRMASGDKDPLAVGDFGVIHLSSHAAGNSSVEEGSDYLSDDKRAAGPPIGGNQRNPTHG